MARTKNDLPTREKVSKMIKETVEQFKSVALAKSLAEANSETQLKSILEGSVKAFQSCAEDNQGKILRLIVKVAEEVKTPEAFQTFAEIFLPLFPSEKDEQMEVKETPKK